MALISSLNDALATAIEAGRVEAQTPEPHWFPCGFAWLSYQCRKNSKIGKELQSAGFRWNDYDKAWQTSLYDAIPSIENMSQSMDYRARVLNAVCNSLKKQGFTEFYVNTRID